VKTVHIECITPGELRRAVAALVAKLGGQGKAAAEIGVAQATLSQFLGGYDSMTRKALSYFGLEQRKVYVKKGTQGSGSPPSDTENGG
jgi:hypothetical protein